MTWRYVLYTCTLRHPRQWPDEKWGSDDDDAPAEDRDESRHSSLLTIIFIVTRYNYFCWTFPAGGYYVSDINIQQYRAWSLIYYLSSKITGRSNVIKLDWTIIQILYQDDCDHASQSSEYDKLSTLLSNEPCHGLNIHSNGQEVGLITQLGARWLPLLVMITTNCFKYLFRLILQPNFLSISSFSLSV